MPHLSFPELIKHRVPFTTAEAVELTLAVAHVLDTRRADDAARRVPRDEHILLSNTGEVTFATVDGSTDRDENTALASLLRRLLQLDDSAATDRRGRVPGGLLALLARTLRQIDLPAPGRDEFRTALARFTGDGAPAATLSILFWRAASLRRAVTRKCRAPGLPPARNRVAPVVGRSLGPPRAELRRALRDLEREVLKALCPTGTRIDKRTS